jgi:hypothetical protein
MSGVTFGTTVLPLPLSVALYTCRCGASAVGEDLQRPPRDWGEIEGEPRCPVCCERRAGERD